MATVQVLRTGDETTMTNQVAKVIECPCGVVLRGSSDDETVANAQRHAKDNHDMALTREQAMSMARPA